MKIRFIILLIVGLAICNLLAETALFYVSNAAGDTIFAVYPSGITVKNEDGDKVFSAGADSVRFYLDDSTPRGSRGGFAIGGVGSGTRGVHTQYFNLSPDSVRFYLKEQATTRGSRGGFAIGGVGSGTRPDADKYFNLENTNTPEIINPAKARMLWYPSKEAFRVGKVLIASPDSVGTNSVATGFESKAIGDWAQAFGYKAKATGDYSTAIGREAQAENENSFAFGYQAKAMGSGSYAFGSVPRDSLGNPVYGISPSTAIGDYSFSFGMGTLSSGIGSLATGVRTESSGYASTAMGYKSKASGSTALSIGNNSEASGYDSIALGSSNTVSGSRAVGMGINNTASGYSAFALGNTNTASGDRSISLGDHNTASQYGTVAIGESNVADHERAYTMGIGNTVSNYGAVALGENNISSGIASVAMGTTNSATGSYSTASGRDNQTTADYATSFGGTNLSSGSYSTTFGRDCIAGGDYSMAMGISAESDSMYSVAIGYYAKASGKYAVSMGENNTASGIASFAVGRDNTSSGNYSTAMGYYGTASGAWSLSAGYENTALGNSSIALGSGVNTQGSSCIGLGEDLDLDGLASVGLGRNIDSTGGLGTGCFLFGDYSYGTALSPTHQNQFAARAQGGFRFYTTSNYTDLNTVSIKSSSGDMGIGTTSPRHKLNIVDEVSTTTGTDGAFIDIENNDNTTGVTSGIRFKNGNVNDYFKSAIYFQDAASYGRGNLIFANDGTSNNADVNTSDADLTIEYDGSVCVGTTTSTRKFFVNGSAGGTGPWYNDSDRRLKKEIKTIPRPLDKVMKLRGVNFKWKDSEKRGNKEQMGFIAQEAKDVIPEVVDKGDEYYSMQYAPVTALLVEAVKELKTENDELKKRLEKLEKEMAARKRIIK